MNDQNNASSEDLDSIPKTQDKEKHGSAWLEFGPVLAYVIIFNIARRYDADNALYIGVGVFAAATLISIIFSWFRYGKISPTLAITAVIVFGSAAITLGFKNKTFFYMKPTAVNLLFGTTIIGSLLMGKNIFHHLMRHLYELPEHAWRTMAWRWGFFFLFMAGLNEFIWRNFSEAFWSNFKLVGVLPITLVFAALNAPLIIKHMQQIE